MNRWVVFAMVALLAPLSACTTLPSTEARNLTVGVVQQQIRRGMSQTEVALVLGTPNLVTRDEEGKETWLYDKVSTEKAFSGGSGGVTGFVLGVGNSVTGGAVPFFSQSRSASSTTQRTLTVVIKFVEGEVDDYSYFTSSF